MPSQIAERVIQPTPVVPAWPGLITAAPFIIQHEGTRLTSYQDTAGVWTIGNGSTHLLDGSPVTAGMKITLDEAHQLLVAHMHGDAELIYRAIKSDVPVSTNQLAALLSLAYNEGAPRVCASAIMHLLNGHDHDSACDHFIDWIYVRDPVTRQLVKSQGLINRRRDEQVLWRTP